MRMMKQVFISLLVMSLLSVLLLIGLSVLTYIFKWQADTALVGITIIYIVVGFVGGVLQKRFSYVENMGRKLVEAILLGTLFMAILVLASFLMVDVSFAFSTRFLMIWMLIVGSASLGRIL